MYNTKKKSHVHMIGTLLHLCDRFKQNLTSVYTSILLENFNPTKDLGNKSIV